MKKLVKHQGVTAPILRTNVDTDAIIPSREMKLVSKKGLSAGLFAGWRYTEVGGRTLNPDFILNQEAYKNTSILLSSKNFGCGSSREHAVWALAEYGIRVIIASSFGAIFHGNCIRNGILPVTFSDEIIVKLAEQIKDPQTQKITVDLKKKVVISVTGEEYPFTISKGSRDMLLEGLDQIGVTMKKGNDIVNFEKAYSKKRAWLF